MTESPKSAEEWGIPDLTPEEADAFMDAIGSGHTAEKDAGRMDPHVLTIEKVHEGKWNRAVFDFLAKYRAMFQPPYPSTVALLTTGDLGHARAYARAINEHVAKHVPGGYLVTIAPICAVEATRVTPPERTDP